VVSGSTRASDDACVVIGMDVRSHV
jgi:hypothetical protein